VSQVPVQMRRRVNAPSQSSLKSTAYLARAALAVFMSGPDVEEHAMDKTRWSLRRDHDRAMFELIRRQSIEYTLLWVLAAIAIVTMRLTRRSWTT
jgi:hypothetical protein